MLIVMERRDRQHRTLPDSSDGGVIVQATIDLLRKGAERVFCEYKEIIVSQTGELKPEGSYIEIGDTVIFQETIDEYPPELVATKLSEDVWYVISTSEIPPSGYPTDRDAARAAEAETKRLDIFVTFICGYDPDAKCEAPHDWMPDERADAKRILGLIQNTNKRWRH